MVLASFLLAFLSLHSSEHLGEPLRYEDVLHVLPDGSPDRSVPSNRWVEVRDSQRLAGSFTNGLNSGSPFAWRAYGKDQVMTSAIGTLPRGADPFTLPDPGVRPLWSELKTFLYITRRPLPAMTTKNVYQVVSERTEVEFRRSGTQEASRWRTTWHTLGFREEFIPLSSESKPDWPTGRSESSGR